MKMAEIAVFSNLTIVQRPVAPNGQQAADQLQPCFNSLEFDGVISLSRRHPLHTELPSPPNWAADRCPIAPVLLEEEHGGEDDVVEGRLHKMGAFS